MLYDGEWCLSKIKCYRFEGDRGRVKFEQGLFVETFVN